LLNGTAQRNDRPASASSQINNEEKSSNKNNSKQRFTIVDLDPFGSPANYIDCVMRSVQNGGLVSVTATDTAVLCGKYPDVCLRKYYGMSLSNPYSNELALRLLMSLMALTSSRLGIGIRPLFAHTNMHYVRIYVQAVLSSKMANSVFDNIGYIQHCFRCGNRTASSLNNRSEVCGQCSSSIKTAGWLWLGKIYDKDFVREMLARTYLLKPNVTKHKSPDQDIEMTPSEEYSSEETKEISQNEEGEQAKEKRACKKLKTVQRLLSKCIDEYDDIPFYFTSDEIASRLKIGPPSLETIIDNLSKAGFRTSPTGLNSTGFKTAGEINEIMTFFRG
jgi:tRNA (guanine26-N2/guanine27-N2)-dimethyltransferase